MNIRAAAAHIAVCVVIGGVVAALTPAKWLAASLWVSAAMFINGSLAAVEDARPGGFDNRTAQTRRRSPKGLGQQSSRCNLYSLLSHWQDWAFWFSSRSSWVARHSPRPLRVRRRLRPVISCHGRHRPFGPCRRLLWVASSRGQGHKAAPCLSPTKGCLRMACAQRRLTPPSSGRQKGCAFLPPLMSNVRSHKSQCRITCKSRTATHRRLPRLQMSRRPPPATCREFSEHRVLWSQHWSAARLVQGTWSISISRAWASCGVRGVQSSRSACSQLFLSG